MALWPTHGNMSIFSIITKGAGQTTFYDSAAFGCALLFFSHRGLFIQPQHNIAFKPAASGSVLNWKAASFDVSEA